MKFQHIIYLIAILLSGCGGDCNNLPADFTDYDQAERLVRKTNFKVKQSFRNNDWINKGEYYSCDGETGFLILRMRDEDYIFNNVPIDVWKSLKKSKSKGHFYHDKIKGNYKLILN